MNPKMIKYIELKTGHHNNGPAWIARVLTSKSGSTIYFNNLALKKCSGQGINSNYYDLVSGSEYWISNPKKSGEDRLRSSGKVNIESDIVEDYLKLCSCHELNKHRFKIIPPFKRVKPTKIHSIENEFL